MKSVITREIVISKSTDQVFLILSNLNNWNLWSPWSHIEPMASSEVNGKPGQVGQSLKWQGEVIGSGLMTVHRQQESKLVEINLYLKTTRFFDDHTYF
jgi:hypothetical protein